MTDEEKPIWMFEQAHGKVTGSSYLEVDEDFPPSMIHVMKDGNVCWSKTKAELVFDYLTKDL